jgi:hypothetical protein
VSPARAPSRQAASPAAEAKGSAGVRFNWKIFWGGVVSIVAGFTLLGLGDITVAPILLVLGYCILVPLALIR